MLKIQDLLLASGWYKDREVDINHYLNVLQDEGYEIFEPAVEFLKEYGDLAIEFENPRREDSNLTLIINPIEATRSIFREAAKRYERHCHEAFVIIGEIPMMDMTWYISSLGAFYGGNDDLLLRLGDDFMEALHHVVNGVTLEVITVDDVPNS
ncbi:SUKH-3 domain-containing protein [Paenibacillus thiaminolyticus]|uniref:SUKH-3 domain-containing protein n=1 Tax=Paenibacillus thiaminolyticus TaxID=49283 RepID=UPI0023502191|nr:SUKH-3 domain-containing protein [Paenibacillus thiaminolyticus]WCR24969.1 SUKH-3 domain-containing protein [Paenibacillus thiaminolyticus]